MMDIIIPTVGRWHEQQTLRQLLTAELKVTLVVQMHEAELGAYADYQSMGAKLYVLPKHITTIAPTRQHILEYVGSDETLCMCDDDLVFYQRREDDRSKLREISPEELNFAFDSLDFLLTRFAHAGFAAREGANRNTESIIENTRIMRVLAYDRDVLLDNNIRFDRLEVMEDFDVALQLLEMGMPNAILNEYAHNQGGSGKSGGCSTFRTPALHAANAVKLATLHPGYVKVVQKATKTAWGGGTRTDVQIQWKKAINDQRILRDL